MAISMCAVGYSFSDTCSFIPLGIPGEISLDCGLRFVHPLVVGFGRRNVSSLEAFSVVVPLIIL